MDINITFTETERSLIVGSVNEMWHTCNKQLNPSPGTPRVTDLRMQEIRSEMKSYIDIMRKLGETV